MTFNNLTTAAIKQLSITQQTPPTRTKLHAPMWHTNTVRFVVNPSTGVAAVAAIVVPPTICRTVPPSFATTATCATLRTVFQHMRANVWGLVAKWADRLTHKIRGLSATSSLPNSHTH